MQPNRRKALKASPAYLPALQAEACPTHPIRFGNLDDPASDVARSSQDSNSFRLLESIDTDPKIYYRSKKKWVRDLANAPHPGKENSRG